VNGGDDLCCLAQGEDQTVVFEDPPTGGCSSPFFEKSGKFFRLIVWSKGRREKENGWGELTALQSVGPLGPQRSFLVPLGHWRPGVPCSG
jgi:hypothetical protein